MKIKSLTWFFDFSLFMMSGAFSFVQSLRKNWINGLWEVLLKEQFLRTFVIKVLNVNENLKKLSIINDKL